MRVVETVEVIPHYAFGYLLLLVLFEPLNHEWYRPVATSFFYLMHKVIKDGLVSLRVTFRSTTFVHIQRFDTSLVVCFDPGYDSLVAHNKTLLDFFARYTFSYRMLIIARIRVLCRSSVAWARD